MPPVPPPTVVIQQSGCSRFLAWMGWLGFFTSSGLLCISVLLLLFQYQQREDYFDLTGNTLERFHSGSTTATAKIAIIQLDGMILDGDGFVKHQIDRVAKDDAVKAVVLRVDSPGGTVTGSDYLLHHFKKLRETRQIPLVVSMGSIAASGGYYVSMAVGDQEDSIFAEPTTTTGSIGVIIPHYDLSGLLAELKVADDSIASHPRKQLLSMTRPMPEENREILQRYVNESFDRFKDIVKQGRPAFRDDSEGLNQLATGEIFTAPRALECGLVDRIGFIEDAIQRAAELAGTDLNRVRVVRYQRPASLMNLPLLGQSSHGQSLQAVLELSSPRAYYLSTTLPPLITAAQQDAAW